MDELAALARRQHGMVRTDQAMAFGYSRHVIASRVRRGLWRRLLRGVLVLPSASLPEPALRRRAALLVVGPTGALSHASALAEHGVPVRETAWVHVSVPATGVLPKPRGMVVHRRLPDAPVVRRHGVPLAPVDLAVVQSFAATEDPGVVCAALTSGHTTAGQLRALAHHVAGAPRLRDLLDLIALGCHSPIEIDYLRLVERPFRLPAAERQVPLKPTLRVDVLYRTAGVVVELDGADHHASDSARRADIRRDAELAAMGLLTVRFTGRQVRDEPGWVAQRVRATIAARAA